MAYKLEWFFLLFWGVFPCINGFSNLDLHFAEPLSEMSSEYRSILSGVCFSNGNLAYSVASSNCLVSNYPVWLFCARKCEYRGNRSANLTAQVLAITVHLTLQQTKSIPLLAGFRAARRILSPLTGARILIGRYLPKPGMFGWRRYAAYIGSVASNSGGNEYWIEILLDTFVEKV